VVSGPPGHTFGVEPGRYSVVLGSGGHNQRIVRKVTVEEGRTVPIVPDWAGLTIETVDSIATPFRGEYELVRIDEFEPFGRGFGANPDLGEVVKTWILKPGIYKILGVGQGYNSLINFVTVMLIPGELTKALACPEQDGFPDSWAAGPLRWLRTPKSRRTGNTARISAAASTSIPSSTGSRRDSTMNTTLGLLSTFWLNYERPPYEWQTRIRLDEGLNLSGQDVADLITNADDFLFNSLFIWRFLPWLGPYGLAEMRTSFFPQQIVRSEPNKYFCPLKSDSTLSIPQRFDSSNTFQHQTVIFAAAAGRGRGRQCRRLQFYLF
jgi:hypothetical protein